MEITSVSGLEQEIKWFSQVLNSRFESYKNQTPFGVESVAPPSLVNDDSPYGIFLRKHQLNLDERVILMLALAPHLFPELLTVFIPAGSNIKAPIEFGGRIGKSHRGFLPTGETVLFMLAGTNILRKHQTQQLFSQDHFFSKTNMLSIGVTSKGEPSMAGTLEISEECIDMVVSGVYRKPDYNESFPAKLLETKLDWQDLILPNHTQNQISEIYTWYNHHHTLLDNWGMEGRIKQGYRVLFHGPPGTGKTLTAALIGKKTGQDVYRIDLSKVISKFIGETEKNLARIFDKAENKDWILFFDEADALFSKRTEGDSSNDRHANQEVAYLLQRIEDFNGLVVLATNLKKNIDIAFLRRFQTLVHFPVPKPQEIEKIWTNTFSNKCQLDQDIDLAEISAKYELTGGSILNIVQYCSLKTIERNSKTISKEDLLAGIVREYHKLGKRI